jgi:hypothetical protein
VQIQPEGAWLRCHLLHYPRVVATNESGQVFDSHDDPAATHVGYGGVMEEAKRNDQCIERRGFMDTSYFYSVSEYEEDMGWARCLSSPRARSFHEVIWTEGAPTVEELSTDWLKTPEGKFRICDRGVYDAQMRVLIGLD